MGRHLKKAFLVRFLVLALNSACVAPMTNFTEGLKPLDTTKEEYNITGAPKLLGTTEEEYVTGAPKPLGTTEEEYITDGPELLGTTEEEYVTDGPELLDTMEEGYVMDAPELPDTTKEKYVTDAPELPDTTEEEYVTDAPELLGAIEEEYVRGAPELLDTTRKENFTDADSQANGQLPKKSKSCSGPYIWLVIIGILTILCTILLVSTIAFAYQASNLKKRLRKRSVRSNSDFIKTASLWSNGARQVPEESAETNVMLEEVRPLKDEVEAKLS
ncbi:uncharacterized protein LOC127581152 [Pristis pectinata]|uniref:uncharacterized protein LOC127581152 n=1 Tax=Pristis pectinata TaxID=685728 RepID=UPI00223D5D1F|nr:uncharacterized protein LOC127581152 [Pristis pectinata]